MKLLHGFICIVLLKTVVGHPYLDEIKAFATHLRAELASQDDDLGEEPSDLGEEPDMLTSQTDEGLRMRLDKLLPNNVSAMGNQVEDQARCLHFLIIMAFTSDLHYAASDDHPKVSLRINGNDRTLSLYDRIRDDMTYSHGDMWAYSISSFGFPSGYPFDCLTSWDIYSVKIHADGNDGWNIGSIVTLVASNDHIELLTADFHVNRWIDGNDRREYKSFELTQAAYQTDEVMKMSAAKLSGDVSAMRFNPRSCLTKLYIMAFTSLKRDSNTAFGSHVVTVRVKSATKSILLRHRYTPNGDTYYAFKRNKGDMWTYKFSDFGFHGCIKLGDIKSVAINAHSDDGWNIGSIVTLVGDTEGGYALLTRDIGVDRWVDTGNHKHFELTRNY